MEYKYKTIEYSTQMQFTSVKTAKTLKALILLQRCSTYPYIQNTLVRLVLLQVRQLCKAQEEQVTLSETRWTYWNRVGFKPLLPRKRIAHRYGFSILHFSSQTASTIPIAEDAMLAIFPTDCDDRSTLCLVDDDLPLVLVLPPTKDA